MVLLYLEEHDSVTIDRVNLVLVASEIFPCACAFYTTFRDSYHWATLGGARALGIDHIVGSLEIGKNFDAIVADLSSIPAVYIEDETPEVQFERFIRTGSEKHIKSVFVDGHCRISN